MRPSLSPLVVAKVLAALEKASRTKDPAKPRPYLDPALPNLCSNVHEWTIPRTLDHASGMKMPRKKTMSKVPQVNYSRPIFPVEELLHAAEKILAFLRHDPLLLFAKHRASSRSHQSRKSKKIPGAYFSSSWMQLKEFHLLARWKGCTH